MELLKRCDGKCVRENVSENFTFDKRCDICVVGMGTSGAISVITAAKSGLDVIGIDRLNGLGGIGTLGGVYDYYFGNYGGAYEKYNVETDKLVDSLPYADSTEGGREYSKACYVKALLMEKDAIDFGAKLVYDAAVCGVYMEEKRVAGVQYIKDTKIVSVGAKVVIDASGEGTVASFANLPEFPARAWDNLFIRTSKPVLVYHEGYMHGLWNMIGNIDSRSADSISESIIHGYTIHPLYYKTHENHKDLYPFECTILGQRQAYRIVAEDPITFDDFIDGRKYEKPLFYAFSTVDTATSDVAFDNKNNIDWRFLCDMKGLGFSQPVEAGALIPKGIDGMLVTGKGAGVDCDMSGLLRMKRDLEKCGEAVAEIAVNAVRNNISVREVKYCEIEKVLRKSGCLDDSNNYGLCEITDRLPKGYHHIELLTDTDEIYKAMSGSKHNIAMWSARVYKGNKINDCLKAWLSDADFKVRFYSAIVLAIRGLDDGKNVIREVVDNPENYEKSFLNKAICILGRLNDKEYSKKLFEIMYASVEKLISGKSQDTGAYSLFGCRDIDTIRFCAVSLYNIGIFHKDVKILDELEKWCNPENSDDENIAYAKKSLFANLRK